MIKNKLLLTDFTSNRWKGVNFIENKNLIKKLNKHSNDSPLFGEINNPIGFEVDLMKVSHVITNLEFDNGKIYGDVKVLDTPQGKILNDRFKNNIEVKFSIRAVGSEIKKIYIKEIFTWDIK